MEHIKIVNIAIFGRKKILKGTTINVIMLAMLEKNRPCFFLQNLIFFRELKTEKVIRSLSKQCFTHSCWLLYHKHFLITIEEEKDGTKSFKVFSKIFVLYFCVHNELLGLKSFVKYCQCR